MCRHGKVLKTLKISAAPQSRAASRRDGVTPMSFIASSGTSDRDRLPAASRGWSGAPSMGLWRVMAFAGTLAVLLLQGFAVARQSLTSDEIFHALAGDQADRYGQNDLNLEHPPLMKMVAALPLLSTPRPVAPLAQVTSTKPICDAAGIEI